MAKLYRQNFSLDVIHNLCETIQCQPKEKYKILFPVDNMQFPTGNTQILNNSMQF
jgi:hypothetical protein